MSLVPYSSGTTDLTPYARAAGRYLRGAWRNYNKTPANVHPVTRYDLQAMRVAALQRQVARISPAVENMSIAPSVFSASANATTYWEYSISAGLISSAEMGAKYLGDKYRHLSLLMRMIFNENINLARVIVYTPRSAGDRIGTTIDFQTIPDETKFTVLHDTILFPIHNAQPRKNILIRRQNINRITTVDRTGPTAGTIKGNEICVYVLAQNLTATARDNSFWFQARFQNK